MLYEEKYWDFNLAIAYLITLAVQRSIWDLHFLIVHNRVFRKTKKLLNYSPIESIDESPDRRTTIVENLNLMALPIRE